MYGSVSFVSRHAFANHGPNRFGVQNCTFSVDSTRFSFVARIDAFTTDASVLGWTVVIFSTFLYSNLDTTSSAIANCAWWTDTFDHMVVNLAFCRCSARVAGVAWVVAFVVHASSTVRTLAIRSKNRSLN